MPQVIIGVNSSGTFTYSLDPVPAKRGEKIEWECTSGPFAVVFGVATPFADGGFKGKKKGTSGAKPVGGPVRGNAVKGTYKYVVAVTMGDEVYVDDPQVIIG